MNNIQIKQLRPFAHCYFSCAVSILMTKGSAFFAGCTIHFNPENTVINFKNSSTRHDRKWAKMFVLLWNKCGFLQTPDEVKHDVGPATAPVENRCTQLCWISHFDPLAVFHFLSVIKIHKNHCISNLLRQCSSAWEGISAVEIQQNRLWLVCYVRMEWVLRSPIAEMAAWAVSVLTSVQYPFSSSNSMATLSSLTSSTNTCTQQTQLDCSITAQPPVKLGADGGSHPNTKVL